MIAIALIKTRHNNLFKSKIDELREDIGRSIIARLPGEIIDCTFCIWDDSTKRSSGIPQSGVDWTTHPDYKGTMIICPNCRGRGRIDSPIEITISDVIIEDKSGIVYIKGKLGLLPEGTKLLIGKLQDILVDPDDTNSDMILNQAISIVIDDQDYKIISTKKFGLKDQYLFESLVSLSNVLSENEGAL